MDDMLVMLQAHGLFPVADVTVAGENRCHCFAKSETVEYVQDLLDKGVNPTLIKVETGGDEELDAAIKAVIDAHAAN